MVQVNLLVLGFCNLGKRAPTNIAISLTRDNLRELVSTLTSNAINKSESKICRKTAVRTRKGFTRFISNEDISYIIKIKNSLEIQVC